MKKTLILVTLLLGVSMFFAFANEYTFVQESATYTEITGGTVLVTGNIDDAQYLITMPFNFVYDSALIPTVAMSTNGYVSFNAGTVGFGYGAISSTAVGNGVAAVMSRDLRGSPIGELRYEVLGTAPNRHVVFQWKNWTAYGASYVNDHWNFQVIIYEGSNKIEYHYGPLNFESSFTDFAQVGLRGATNADYTNRTTLTDWTATTAGAANNATCRIGYLIYPPSGLKFVFRPPVATDPPNPAVLTSPANGAVDVPLTQTLNWATGGGGTDGYYLSYGTVSPYAVIINLQDMGPATTYAPVLAYSTQYWWEIIAYNANGNAAPSSATFTTMSDPTIYTFPHSEGFEGGVTLPFGWARTAAAGSPSYNWEVVTSDAYHGAALPYEGSYFARLYVYLAPLAYNPYCLVTPPIDLSGASKKLSYWAWIGANGEPTPLDVEISTDGMATWNLLYSFDLSETNAWIYREHSLAGYNANPSFIRFKATSNYGYNFCDLGLDYITLEEEPQVPVELSSFTATLTAQNYVQLSWVSQTESQMMGYLVYRNITNDQSTSVLIDTPMIPATNTSSAQTYTATDRDVEIGSTYFYWLEAVDYTSSTYHGPVSVTVEGEVPPVLPELTSLRESYPNPFRAGSSASIEVALKAGETGTVTIYNVHGQVVKNYTVCEGCHTLKWDGRDASGTNCGSGIYFYRLSTPSFSQTRRMVLAK